MIIWPFKSTSSKFVASILFIVSNQLPASSQQSVPGVDSSARPIATMIRASEAPVIDGNLGDGTWAQAVPVTGFTQAEPQQGQPASERTEVRLLYDDEAIFIGVTMHDNDPSQIVTTANRRDAGLGDQDSFQVIFDTFLDRQNGFVFGTNAAGVQYDAQVRNQTDTNSDWDGSWEVRTTALDNGWTAEFRIPFRTLRFGPPPQVWGLNFMRNIQRRRERTYWAPLPREFDLGRLSSSGELRGLEVDPPRNFKVQPWVVSSANRNFTPDAKTDFDHDLGFDTKLSVTSSLNLDLTYNTDFAQVEVDTQQINLTRYNVRFPEKRPFFLENSGLFQVGKGNELDLFFSRRIGLDEDDGLVPIIGGARLSGKAAGLNVGLLNMQTETTGGTTANNFTVARVNRELPNRSAVGAIFVNRQGTGARAGTDNWNRTWGMNGTMGVGERVTFEGFAAATRTPGLSGREFAYNFDSAYNDPKHAFNFEYGVTGEDFNPEAGYLSREDGYRRMHFRFQETMRQEKIRSWGFREFLPHVTYTRYDYLDGRGLQNAELHSDNHWDWENGNYISTAINGTWEGLEKPFEIYPGIVIPAGRHGGLRFTPRANTDRRKWIFGRIQWDIGRFYNGNQSSPTLQMIIRRGGKFTVDTTWNYRDIDLPQGSFKTNLGNMRVTYNFTPSIFVQSLLQFNDRTQRWSTNLRLHLLRTAGTGLFVVYNDTESLQGLGPVNRAFIVKYVHQFDIFR